MLVTRRTLVALALAGGLLAPVAPATASAVGTNLCTPDGTTCLAADAAVADACEVATDCVAAGVSADTCTAPACARVTTNGDRLVASGTVQPAGVCQADVCLDPGSSYGVETGGTRAAGSGHGVPFSCNYAGTGIGSKLEAWADTSHGHSGLKSLTVYCELWSNGQMSGSVTAEWVPGYPIAVDWKLVYSPANARRCVRGSMHAKWSDGHVEDLALECLQAPTYT